MAERGLNYGDFYAQTVIEDSVYAGRPGYGCACYTSDGRIDRLIEAIRKRLRKCTPLPACSDEKANSTPAAGTAYEPISRHPSIIRSAALLGPHGCRPLSHFGTIPFRPARRVPDRNHQAFLAGLLKNCSGFSPVIRVRRTCAPGAWIFGKVGRRRTRGGLDANPATWAVYGFSGALRRALSAA
jgi:hypothetical protein